MTPMGRKHKYSNGKRSKPCVIVGAVKKHFARTASVSVDDYHFEIKQEVVDDLKNNAQCEGNELCGVLMGIQVGDNLYRISKISPPCIKSHARCGCKRDAAMANRFIEEDYNQSEYTRSILESGIHILKIIPHHRQSTIALLKTIINQRHL